MFNMNERNENADSSIKMTTKAECIQTWVYKFIVRILDHLIPLLLTTVLALVVAFISSHFDHLIHLMNRYIELISSWRYLTSPLCLCLSALIVQIIHPTTRGSGIPEMKLFLSNWESPRMIDYLSFKAFIVKIVGLGFSILSGFPVGKEGPFVHISCIWAYLIKFQLIPKANKLKLCYFRKLFAFCNCNFFKFVGHHYLHWKLQYRRNVDVYRFLCTGCALGVACTFGAPVGGVMFSIEVTSQIFDVSNYWHCFFTGLTGALFFRFFIGGIFHETWFFKPYLKANLPGEEYEFYHFVVYFGIGLASGVLGSIFIFTYSVFFKAGQIIYRLLNYCFRKLSTKNTFNCFLFHPRTSSRRIMVTFIFTLLMSIILCVGDFLQKTDFKMPLSQHQQLVLFFDDGKKLLEAFKVQTSNLTSYQSTISTSASTTSSTILNREIDLMINFHNYLLPLLLFLFMKMLFFCPIVTCLPVPNGLFFSLMVGGACLGRLLGDLTKISSAGCAIVGAAALSGAITHSVSTAVIITEMTEEIQYLIPCAVAAYTGQLVSSIICQYSIYEMIMRNRQMPYMPDSDESLYQVFKQATAESFLASGNYIKISSQSSNSDNPHMLFIKQVRHPKTSISEAASPSDHKKNATGLKPNIATDNSIHRLIESSTNGDLRKCLVSIKSKKSEIQWKLIPVVKMVFSNKYIDKNCDPHESLVGFIRTEAAAVYLEKYFEIIMKFSTRTKWWLQDPDQILTSSLDPSAPDLPPIIETIQGCGSFCVQEVEYKYQEWKSFLSEEINWSELLEEVPCSITMGTSLPNIQNFVQKNFLPQVFLVDNGEVKGIITRENIIEQMKKLHHQYGRLAVAYRTDLMTLPMRTISVSPTSSSSQPQTKPAQTSGFRNIFSKGTTTTTKVDGKRFVYEKIPSHFE